MADALTTRQKLAAAGIIVFIVAVIAIVVYFTRDSDAATDTEEPEAAPVETSKEETPEPESVFVPIQEEQNVPKPDESVSVPIQEEQDVPKPDTESKTGSEVPPPAAAPVVEKTEPEEPVNEPATDISTPPIKSEEVTKPPVTTVPDLPYEPSGLQTFLDSWCVNDSGTTGVYARKMSGTDGEWRCYKPGGIDFSKKGTGCVGDDANRVSCSGVPIEDSTQYFVTDTGLKNRIVDWRRRPVNDAQAAMDSWCNAFARSRNVKFDGTTRDKMVYRFERTAPFGTNAKTRRHACFRNYALNYNLKGPGCLDNSATSPVECYGTYNRATGGVYRDWVSKIKDAIKAKTGNAPQF